MLAKRNRLLHWQVVTLLVMLLGYSGYYLAARIFSVALPLIARELGVRGLSPGMARIKLGTIASLRVAAYAIGKFPAGALSDHLGGRRNFLAGMFGSALCVLLFALSDGLPLFTLAWVRQSLGSVSGLGRGGQGVLAPVLLSQLWHGNGHHQPQLPVG